MTLLGPTYQSPPPVLTLRPLAIDRKKKADEYIDVYPKSCMCGCYDFTESSKVDKHTVEELEIKKVKVIFYRRHYR